MSDDDDRPCCDVSQCQRPAVIAVWFTHSRAPHLVCARHDARQERLRNPRARGWQPWDIARLEQLP